MRLSPIYEQKLAEVKQEGIQEGIQVERRNLIENLLRVRFGSLNAELRVITEALLTLSPQEFTPLLLQLSREELLERFL
ncbi:hypothetical protein [Nostoc sp.]|uniref:hypothetical protein n=1 Tax=Nostoc sp. TaxID=1180 RepID=UPI002FEF85AC